MKLLKKLAQRLLAVGPIPALKYEFMRLIWWASWRTKRFNAAKPKVTIVVPVYNVESYVLDCLRSARAQRWPNLEIIAVNDGSTDISPELIAALAETTSELRIINQENQGLGAARNAGLAAIEDTDYVMFLDSDDLLPVGAVSRLVKSAERSGSPLVVGKTVCFYGARYFDRTSTSAFFAKNRVATNLNKNPELLGDATSWNKLYNWQFWQQHKFVFPTGVAYEDMTLVATAYLAAKQFDVLARPVYFWRVRAEGESLSKRTTELKSLSDRLLSIEQINRILLRAIEKGLVETHVRESWQTRIISMDLQLFVAEINRTDSQFFDTLKARAGTVLMDAPESVWANATGKYRKAVWAALHGSRDQTLQILAEG